MRGNISSISACCDKPLCCSSATTSKRAQHINTSELQHEVDRNKTSLSDQLVSSTDFVTVYYRHHSSSNFFFFF